MKYDSFEIKINHQIHPEGMIPVPELGTSCLVPDIYSQYYSYTRYR